MCDLLCLRYFQNHLLHSMMLLVKTIKRKKFVTIRTESFEVTSSSSPCLLCSKCSPSNIRRNETNDQHSFLVQWLIRLPGKQAVHVSIPCEGRVLFFCSVLWSYHYVAISVIRTRETITSERIITMFLHKFCI